MGLNDTQPNMQNSGLTGIDRLAYNAMFPQSQMDKTQYAVPSQLPTSAETISSDYDAKTDAYTGLPNAPFKKGGLAGIPRYNGEDGSDVQAPQDPTFGNKDLTALAANGVDPTTLQQLNTLKSTDPGTYNSQLMQQLGTNLVQNYNGNVNYDALLNQIQSLKDTAPKDYYNTMANFYGHQMGWQVGQNTSERNAPVQANLQGLLQDAQKAGIDPNQLSAIAAQANQSGNVQNQRRIATEAASGGNGIGDLVKVAAPIALSMALGPEMLALMPELGAVGAGALTGATVGGVGAGLTGGDVGKGILMGGATGALGGSLNGVDPSLAQGLKGAQTANSIYNATKAGGQNLGADINAFKGIANMAPTMSAAHGGLMSSGGKAESDSILDGLTDKEKQLVKLELMAQSLSPRPVAEYTGNPFVPQGAFGRAGVSAELDDNSKLRAGLSGLAMAIPGQQGVKAMPGSMDVGYNTQAGPGNLDLSAFRSINPIPGQGHAQGLNARYTIPFAQGGDIGHLGGYSDGGRLLKGPGDGMSDNIPASIGDKQPARLADGEFVIPADVVSHLGNGSTDAGAKQLYAMMDRVRKARTGNEKQGKQIKPSKFLPKG